MANSCYVTFQKSFKTCFHIWDCIHTAPSVCTCIRERVPNASSQQTDEAHFRQPLFHRKWDPLTFAIQSVWKCIAWNRSTPPCPDMHSPPPLCPLFRLLLPPYIFLSLQSATPCSRSLSAPGPFPPRSDNRPHRAHATSCSALHPLPCAYDQISKVSNAHTKLPVSDCECAISYGPKMYLSWPKYMLNIGWLQFHCNMYFKGQENIFNLKKLIKWKMCVSTYL